MSLSIPSLSKRITLEKPSYDDPLSPRWESVATVWASLIPLRIPYESSEIFLAGQLQTRQIYRITLRYRRDITTAWRVSHGTRLFEIKHVLNIQERNVLLELMADERSILCPISTPASSITT